MAELLTPQDIGKALGDLTDWTLDDGALKRVVELADFTQAMLVVNRVAEIAENDNHHPDIDIRWNKVTFRCSTHSEGGITASDVSLAREIDGVVEAVRQA
ncbi:4a-hydroxytetrahydrobiopterin dehydratase [Actinokineospora auranticolor]|uniref:Putative pterin-4-alpha-carbinolamine dehydratase n=1 Tax=Actinokineospora auranticolor TaxID=155976 RepID=A0A2S6GY85_9PSEU|nr:4a-hydroxytetrahydrobiopterin dehydratase [Actinokineospora auranticolor]PPK70195.1 4a-hydroxytetrahydrobiopterin dehydratase [Actinokineospora auranticolor]